jgi:hypothetical protein
MIGIPREQTHIFAGNLTSNDSSTQKKMRRVHSDVRLQNHNPVAFEVGHLPIVACSASRAAREEIAFPANHTQDSALFRVARLA